MGGKLVISRTFMQGLNSTPTVLLPDNLRIFIGDTGDKTLKLIHLFYLSGSKRGSSCALGVFLLL